MNPRSKTVDFQCVAAVFSSAEPVVGMDEVGTALHQLCYIVLLSQFTFILDSNLVCSATESRSPQVILLLPSKIRVRW